MNNSSKKIVEFFFGKLEENIIKNEVKAEGVSSFIMVVSEYWDFLNQEKWLHYLYNLLVLVRSTWGCVEKSIQISQFVTNALSCQSCGVCSAGGRSQCAPCTGSSKGSQARC